MVSLQQKLVSSRNVLKIKHTFVGRSWQGQRHNSLRPGEKLYISWLKFFISSLIYVLTSSRCDPEYFTDKSVLNPLTHCVTKLGHHWLQMAFCLFGTKPLSKPMLKYCQLDPWEHISVKFWSKYNNFRWRKCIWKRCLKYGSHFVSAPMLLMVWYPSARSHYLRQWGHIYDLI